MSLKSERWEISQNYRSEADQMFYTGLKALGLGALASVFMWVNPLDFNGAEFEALKIGSYGAVGLGLVTVLNALWYDARVVSPAHDKYLATPWS